MSGFPQGALKAKARRSEQTPRMWLPNVNNPSGDSSCSSRTPCEEKPVWINLEHPHTHIWVPASAQPCTKLWGHRPALCLQVLFGGDTTGTSDSGAVGPALTIKGRSGELWRGRGGEERGGRAPGKTSAPHRAGPQMIQRGQTPFTKTLAAQRET